MQGRMVVLDGCESQKREERVSRWANPLDSDDRANESRDRWRYLRG